MGDAPGKSVAEEQLTALSSTSDVSGSSQCAEEDLRRSDLLATMVATAERQAGMKKPRVH